MVIPKRGAGYSRVTHPFAARVPRRAFPLDLHVLSTPPAFVLSQDQTLQQKLGKLSQQQKVAKGIQDPQRVQGKNNLGTGFTSTLLSSQRTTAKSTRLSTVRILRSCLQDGLPGDPRASVRSPVSLAARRTLQGASPTAKSGPRSALGCHPQE